MHTIVLGEEVTLDTTVIATRLKYRGVDTRPLLNRHAQTARAVRVRRPDISRSITSNGVSF